MLARIVRRAFKEQEIQQSSRDDESNDDKEEASPTRNPAQNLFSLFGLEEINAEDEVEIRKSKKKSKGKREGKSSMPATVEAFRAAEEESVVNFWRGWHFKTRGLYQPRAQ